MPGVSSVAGQLNSKQTSTLTKTIFWLISETAHTVDVFEDIFVYL